NGTEQKRFYFEVGLSYLICGERQKLDGRPCFALSGAKKISSAIRDHQGFVAIHGFKNFCRLTTFYRDPPELRAVLGLAVVDKPSVGRFDRCKASILSDLGGIPSIRRYLPYLPLAGAHGIEVDPPAVSRPARIAIVRRRRGHPQWLATTHVHYPDIVFS